jgi:hypothetical protein
MSFEITTAFVEQYKANIQLLSQQKGSVLRDSVMNESVRGKTCFFDQIGKTNAVKKTTRHGDTPLVGSEHARRRVTLEDYEWADLVDQLDKVKMLNDPTSAYAISAGMALGRSMDSAIIAAATGSADTGVDGSTAVALPAAQQVAVTVGAPSGFTNDGLNIQKLIQARETFGLNDVDVNDPMNQLSIVVSQKQISDLLEDQEIQSSDFNTVRALVRGEIDTYLGFKFIRTQLLAHDSSTDIRTCFAFAKSGIGLAVGQDIMGRISERDDKSYSTQVYASMSIGATRLEEEKVVSIACDESPA